jgi:isopenicillin N synthase-like dioxygenase
MAIPVIDLSADPAAIQGQWGAAFETFGFAIVTGHRVPDDLMHEFHETALAFFDLPMAAKLACSFAGQQQSQGYVPFDRETVAATFGQMTPPDLCESISFRNIGHDPERPNRWPAELPALRRLGEAYFVHVHRLAHEILALSAVALDLPPDYFAPFHDRMNTTLRLVHYPDQIIEPLPGQLRYGAHTDYGGFTILLPDSAPGGLQVLMPDGSWEDVRPDPGALIINTGDAMARWTNDRFRSNIHRVINPPRGLTGSTRRLSIVCFTGPNSDAELVCLPTCHGTGNPPRYQPIRFAEHLQEKLRQSMPAPL